MYLNDEYNIEKTKQLVNSLQNVFDIVRLVEPLEQKIILFNDNNDIIFNEYECYQVWNKNTRCDNCISMKALYDNCRVTKYEFINQDVYHVVSKPITVCDKCNKKHRFTLEVVTNITDEILFESFGKGEIIKKIIQTNTKIYKDSLTEVYNRRYFNERMFCHNRNCDVKNAVAFIMIDIKKFKSINDQYGHIVGDKTLKSVGKILLKSVKKTDSVIRFGGDEFLVILIHCTEEKVLKKIKQLKEQVEQCVYDKKNDKHVVADFGYSYTDKFDESQKFINQMIKKADKNMYLEKHSTEYN